MHQQFVAVNGVKSNLTGISCGIPKEPVLGPILFYFMLMTFSLCSTLFVKSCCRYCFSCKEKCADQSGEFFSDIGTYRVE